MRKGTGKKERKERKERRERKMKRKKGRKERKGQKCQSYPQTIKIRTCVAMLRKIMKVLIKGMTLETDKNTMKETTKQNPIRFL